MRPTRLPPPKVVDGVRKAPPPFLCRRRFENDVGPFWRRRRKAATTTRNDGVGVGDDGDADGGMGFVVDPEKADAFETRKLRFERYQREEALRRLRLKGGTLSIEDEEETKPKKKKKCTVCKGKAKVTCEGCKGHGWLNEDERVEKCEENDIKSWFPSWCGHCRGSGLMGCARCFGSGEFRQPIGFRLFGDEDDDEEDEEDEE